MSRNRPRCRPAAVAAVLLATLLTGSSAHATPPVGPAGGSGWLPAPVSGVPVPAVRQAAADLSMLDLEAAWQHSTGAGVTVAVLDSGVDATHPALAGRVLPGADFVDGSTDGRTDPVGHGTAVASLIAGEAGTATEGLAPDATILPVRVLDEQNRYQEASTVAEGVTWAVEQGADVINLSLGGQRESATLADAITYAMANDVVVVACTGNRGSDDPDRIWYPAREPGVVAVAGLRWVDDGGPRHWPRSLAGRETVLAAPAVLTGAAPGGGSRQVQGTSFAAALVSATAALARSRWAEAPAGEIVNRLVATATDLGEAGRDDRFGFGAVDPVQALTARIVPTSANPLDTKARHGTGGLGPAPRLDTGADTPAAGPTVGASEGEPAGAAAEPAVAAATAPPSSWIGIAVSGLGLVMVTVVTALAIDARRLGLRRQRPTR